MARRPKILILISLGWAVRNYLRSTVLSRLSEVADVHVAIPYADPVFEGVFRGALAGIHELPPARSSRRLSVLQRVINGAHASRAGVVVGRHRMQWIARVMGTPRWRCELEGLFAKGCAAFRGDAMFHRLLDRETTMLRALYDGSAQRQMVADLKPDLVFSTFPFNAQESAMVLAANQASIPAACIIHSWDNLSTRGRIVGDYERTLVWSERMKAELRTTYPGIDPARVDVTSTPQFDFYRQSELVWSREEFCSRLGLDPRKSILTYTCVPHRLVPDEHMLIPEVYDALMKSPFADRVQLLVRTHPLGDYSLYAKLGEGRPGLVVSRAWSNDQARYGWFCPNNDDLTLLTSTMRHSAVGYNIRSTMTLDFCIFDTPVINVGFGPSQSPIMDRFIKDFYTYGYYRPVLEVGAAPIATSPADLAVLTGKYLDNPSLHAEKRAKLVTVLCGEVDGRAGDRVATSLSAMLTGSVERQVVSPFGA